jgi:plastocyanin
MVDWLRLSSKIHSEGAEVMATVSIERQNGNVVFNPNPIYIGRTDVVVFVNNDTQAAHQITQMGQAADAWMVNILGPAVPGQDSFTSPGIAFGDAIKGQDSPPIDYVCAMHAGETGQIIIAKR